MNVKAPCIVRVIRRVGNGLQIAEVELPDGTFGEAPAADDLKPGESAQICITVDTARARLYPKALRVEKES